MSRIRLILAGCFVVVFAAGVSTGVLARHLKAPPRHESWLVRELNLTREQQEQMRKIWEPIWKRGRDNRPGISRERDEAVVVLLTEEQRPKYEVILREHNRKLEELSQKRQQAIKDAIVLTKGILTKEQAAKYEEMLKKRPDGRRGGSPDPGLQHWPPGPIER